MAGTTRLELATSDVTGRRSNQLSYVPAPRRTLSKVACRGIGFQMPGGICRADPLDMAGVLVGNRRRLA